MKAAAGSPAVEVRGLVKRYDGRAVVDGLDLTVGQGEIVALLGPNGAGKTTTVEIIEGFREADEGEVRVLGLDPRSDRADLRARLGIMLQHAELQRQVRVLEAVRLFAAFYAQPLSPGMVLDQVGLAARADDRFATLSGGERQRLALALAVIGRPELAVLDEPTAAMDVAARRSTWELLRALRNQGTTILLTTHLLEEAEGLADRLAIVDGGRLIAVGGPAELRALGAAGDGADHPTARRTIGLVLAGPLPVPDEASLARLPGVLAVRSPRSGTYGLLVDEVGETLVRLTEWLWAKRLEPQAIELEEASLEAVYLRLIEEGAGVRGPDGSAPGATEAPAAPEAPDASEKTGTPAEPGAPDAPERWA